MKNDRAFLKFPKLEIRTSIFEPRTSGLIKIAAMTGETDLIKLLRSMKPQLNEREYVFCSLNDSNHMDLNQVIGSFKEKEGLTVIISKMN